MSGQNSNTQNNTVRGGSGSSNSVARPAPPAFDPLHPGLVQPYQSLVSNGHIAEMRVTINPFGFMVSGLPGPALTGPGSNLVEGTLYPIGVILERCRALNLTNPPKRVGKKKAGASAAPPPRPAKSLCQEDFDEEEDVDFVRRVEEVAAACGGATLTGRVRSAGLFTGQQTTSFADWWETAGADARLWALTDGPRRKGLRDGMSRWMVNLACPFRGNANFTVAEAKPQQETTSGTA